MKGWKQLKPHPERQALWTTTRRFPIVCAGRGSGKTELARRYIIRALPIVKPWEDPHYFYGLPVYNQAKRVAWRILKELIPKEWVADMWETELRILTIFGSDLTVVGLDKPMRIEGTQWDGGILDEMSDQKPDVFDINVRPALTDRRGFCWRIGAAKRQGIGANKFREVFKKYKDTPTEDTKSYTWSSEDIVDPAELAAARESMSGDDYDEQFKAQWVSLRGLVHYQFSEENVTIAATYNKNLPIYVGQDFNVDPMSWVLSHAASNGLSVFDEIRISNTNTYETLNELYNRYGQHKAGFIFIGDASARARKTSATKTDFLIISNDNRFENKRMLYSNSNPAVEDRNAAVNALLKNANGQRRLFVNPKCVSLIKDFSGLSYKPNTREVALYPGMGHMSDALGYIVFRLFPIKYTTPETSVVSSG